MHYETVISHGAEGFKAKSNVCLSSWQGVGL